MRHLDEGTLQAWLDRPRSGLAPADAEEIERHLASCDSCAAELQVLVESDMGASEILAGSGLSDIETPEFGAFLEGIGERSAKGRTLAGGSPTGVGLPRGQALAWAASVAVALGVGWVASGTMRGTGAPSEIANPTVALAPESAARPVDGAGSDATPDAAETAGRPQLEAGPAAPPDVGAPASDSPAPTGDLDRPEVATARQAAPSDAAGADDFADVGGVTTDQLAIAESRMRGNPIASQAGFEPLVVPGLVVRSLEFDDSGGSPAVVIRQLLESGDDLVLIEAAAGGPSPAPDVPDGQPLLSVTVGEVSIIGTAPVSVDSLRVLLDAIR